MDAVRKKPPPRRGRGGGASRASRAQTGATAGLRSPEFQGPRLHRERVGRLGGGFTLVLLHGFGASLQTWNEIRPGLAKRYDSVFVDLLGFGESIAEGGVRYDLQEQAGAVIRCIREIGLERIVLVGHSYGGAVALFTYLSLVDAGLAAKVRGLVFLDAPLYPQRLPFFVAVLATPILNSVVLRGTPATLRAKVTLDRLFFDTSCVTDERIHRYARYFDARGAHHSYRLAAKHILPVDSEGVVGRISTIDVPALLVWGENDAVVPIANAYRLQRDLSDSELVVIPRCGHVPHEERPDEALRALTQFLEKQT